MVKYLALLVSSDSYFSEEQVKQGAGELFETLLKDEPALHSWWLTTACASPTLFVTHTNIHWFQLLPTLSGITDKYLSKEGNKPYKLENWSLYSLSVAPAYQGRGISKLLVRVGEDQVSGSILPMWFFG